MKASELKAKDDTALGEELTALQREAFNLRMQKGSGQLARPSEVKVVRRNIARIKTEMSVRRNAK